MTSRTPAANICSPLHNQSEVHLAVSEKHSNTQQQQTSIYYSMTSCFISRALRPCGDAFKERSNWPLSHLPYGFQCGQCWRLLSPAVGEPRCTVNQTQLLHTHTQSFRSIEIQMKRPRSCHLLWMRHMFAESSYITVSLLHLSLSTQCWICIWS